MAHSVVNNKWTLIYQRELSEGEESTELVAPVVKPTVFAAVDDTLPENVWMQMNADFARDAEMEEDLPAARPSRPAAVSREVPALENEVWMELNQDFANEGHAIEAVAPKKTVTAAQAQIEREIGDYGVWWE
jgi:hypothetical protein